MHTQMFNGYVTMELLDQDGNVIKEQTKKNAATEGFLSWMLGKAFSSGEIGDATKGFSKGATGGQYVAVIDTGGWAVYCMSDPIPVRSTDVIPKYLSAHTTVASNVVFQEMEATDNSIAYNRYKNGSWLNMEFTQRPGAGIVRSVHFGRKRADFMAACGLLLGQADLPENAITGNHHYLLSHSATSTSVFKNISNTSNQWINLSTKQVTPLETTAEASLTAANGIFGPTATQRMGGSLVFNNICYRPGGVARNVTGVIATVLRKALTSTSDSIANNGAGVREYSINFPEIVDTNANNETIAANNANILGHFLVQRPDTNQIEFFIGHYVHEVGVRLYKSVLSGMTNSATVLAGTFSEPTLVATLTNGGVPSFSAAGGGILSGIGNVSSGMVSATGFYDISKKQYYFPCFRQIENGILVNIGGSSGSNANFRGLVQGYVFDEEFNIVDEYIAFNSSVGDAFGFNAPCLVDGKTTLVQVNTPTLYIPKISQVMSGVVFDEPFEKMPEQTLRITYRYQLS